MCFFQVSAVKAVLSSGNQDKKEDSVLAKPLRSHAFAAPERIVELTQKARKCAFDFHWLNKSQTLLVFGDRLMTIFSKNYPKLWQK